MRLDIGFLSQSENRIRNDCGPAVIGMLAGVGINDVLARTRRPPNSAFTISDMIMGLRSFGIRTQYKRPLSVSGIVDHLQTARPAVVLVGYGQIPPELQAITFDGAHYVMAVGQAPGRILIHDPLWPQNKGGYMAWPKDVLEVAMDTPTWENLPNQGLLVDRVYPIIKPEEDAGAGWRQRLANLIMDLYDLRPF